MNSHASSSPARSRFAQGARLAACVLPLLAAGAVQAKQTVCVWDVIGKGGDVANAAVDFALAMQKHGAEIELKTYLDERVAVEDFVAGQCDGILATGLRLRRFNAVSTAIDSIGSTTIMRDGRIDLEASYGVVQKVEQIFSAPAAKSLMVNGNYEVAGIFPLGAAYPMVRDRRINSVEALAGKKIAAFDYDKAQSVMIQRIGAQPIAVDITNVGTKFNNGLLDMVTLPAVAYKPFELAKGMGTAGGIGRFPIMIPTMQMVINKTKFPAGFGETSRVYWVGQFDRAMKTVKTAESGIPASAWNDLPAESIPKYVLMLREARVAIAHEGLYDKRGLNILKRVRCSINAADSECSGAPEID